MPGSSQEGRSILVGQLRLHMSESGSEARGSVGDPLSPGLRHGSSASRHETHTANAQGLQPPRGRLSLLSLPGLLSDLFRRESHCHLDPYLDYIMA